MKQRTKKLLKLWGKMIMEHKISWAAFILSIFLSIGASIKMAYFNIYPYYSEVSSYTITLFISTLSLGYISAFLFFVLHDFIPQSKKRLKDIQRAISLELEVYNCVETLDARLFKGAQLDSSAYSRAFVELTTETIIESETRRMKFSVPVEKYLRLLSKYIGHCRGLLPFLDNTDIPVELYNSLTNLDLYELVLSRNAVDGINDNSFDEKAIIFHIQNFAESRDYLKKHIDSLEPYSYIVKKVFVPYD